MPQQKPAIAGKPQTPAEVQQQQNNNETHKETSTKVPLTTQFNIMAVVRKKQDDKYLKALRELITTGGGNRQCFDCGQKGPTYVNMTIGSFVCTRCSGVLRGITPPHRVKSISMATFTQEELDFLKAHGNDLCAKTWLGLWDPKRAIHQDHRELMIDKYERKRYYLEPASPLKSLASIHSQNGYNTNNTNSSNSSNVNDTQQQQQQKIQLTPPTSQRTTANGLHKSSAVGSATTTTTTAISRPQNQQQRNQHNQQDAFMMNNGLNGLMINTNGMKPASSISSTSTGALSDTSSCASNGFGPDADFVADFSAANIYDATTAGVGSPATASTNGYAKIQPIKMQQQQQQMNGVGQLKAELMNGFHYNSHNNNNNQNNIHSTGTDNFADFDHAPIYNAAGLPMPNGMSKNGTTLSGSGNNNNSTPAEDRYAALKDLDEQLRESKAIAEAAATIVSSAVVDSFGNNNNSSNNNNSNSNHANPFKSQQLAAAGAAGTNGLLANPFQAQQQQHQHQQHQQQHQQQQQNTQTNLFGQLTVIPNGIALANGYGAGSQTMSHQQQQPPQGFYNYSNGFAATTAAGNSMFTPLATVASTPPTSNMLGGPNGCGFGFGAMQQQLAATAGGGVGGCFNNPFAAAGALNSNNPFL